VRIHDQVIVTPQFVMQNLAIYLFASGLIFFPGVAWVWLSLLLSTTTNRRWWQRLAIAAGVFGLILIGLSATPLPYWFYGIACSITVIGLILELSSRATLFRWKILLRIVTALLWLVSVAWEFPRQISPTLVGRGSPTLFVIADSITAGVGEREAVTWPVLIQRTHQIQVQDFSRMGAGVVAAYRQAERLPDSGGLVLIEIGGNDMLGTTSLADFEQGLERLLARVCQADRTVIMFELPLPPLFNEYGRIQRRVAAQRKVPLIPKRLLIDVLTTPGNTLDSIHLTQAGHHQMAELVWKLIRPAYE
jgi:acyl-CoA thioesterase-1